MQIEPIAFYHCPIADKFGIPRQPGLAKGLKGEVSLIGEFARPEALRGLEGFSHVWLIWGFHLNAHSKSLTVRPPRLGGNERVGVFASRSPFRPNSLGISAVKIESIDFEHGTISLSGADLADGSPIYDIKPYVPYSDSIPEAKQGFTSHEWNKLEVRFGEGVKEAFEQSAGKEGPELLEQLVQTLELDPRPQYQDDPDRDYGMRFSIFDVHFTVKENILTVNRIANATDSPASF